MFTPIIHSTPYMADKPCARACSADSSYSYQSCHRHYEQQKLTTETLEAEESDQPAAVHVVPVAHSEFDTTCATAGSRSYAAPAVSCNIQHADGVPPPLETGNGTSVNSKTDTSANQTQSEAADTNSVSVDAQTNATQSKIENANEPKAHSNDSETRSNENLQTQTGSDNSQTHSPTTGKDPKPVTDGDSGGNADESQNVPEPPPLTEFQKKVDHFFKTHGHHVYDKITKKYDTYFITPSLEEARDLFTQTNTAPLECYMGIGPEVRKERFLKLISSGDLVQGYVDSIEPSRITITLTCLHNKNRFISDLGIKGVIKYEDLDDTEEKRAKRFEEIKINDAVQAVILSTEEEEIELSMKLDDNTSFTTDLGILEKESEKSVLTKLTGERQFTEDYLPTFTGSADFLNPRLVENLALQLGIDYQVFTSFLKPVSLVEIPRTEHYDDIKRRQRSKWSMNTVAIGVEHFKENRIDKALKYYNHALDIDRMNIEGYVARGALKANEGQYAEAIKDFETALTLNHSHANAKKYLVETQTAQGEKLEKEGDLQGALKCYKEALADNPGAEKAKYRAEIITKALENQREREKKKLEEEMRLKRLQKIIKKQKKKAEREKEFGPAKLKKEKKKRKKRSSKKKYKKKKRSTPSSEEYSSSIDSDSSCDSHDTSHDRSRSWSSERSHKSKNGKSHSEKLRKSRSEKSRSKSYEEANDGKSKKGRKRSYSDFSDESSIFEDDASKKQHTPVKKSRSKSADRSHDQSPETKSSNKKSRSRSKERVPLCYRSGSRDKSPDGSHDKSHDRSHRKVHDRRSRSKSKDRKLRSRSRSYSKSHDRSPDRRHSRYLDGKERNQSCSRSPDKKHGRSPDKKRSRYSGSPDKKRSRYSRSPDKKYSRYTRSPDKKRSRYSRSPEKKRSRYSRSPNKKPSRNSRSPDHRRDASRRHHGRAYNKTRSRSRERQDGRDRRRRSRSRGRRSRSRSRSKSTRSHDKPHRFQEEKPSFRSGRRSRDSRSSYGSRDSRRSKDKS